MDKKFFVLNLVYAIADLVFACYVVLAVTWAANHFDKLWIMAFLIVPVVLFNSHSVILGLGQGAESEGENGKT